VWSPEAQSKLISYFSPNQTKLTKNDAIFYACVVIGLKVGHLIVAYNCRIALVEVFLGMKSAVSGLLYRKSLKLTPESLSEVTAGKISTIIIKDLDALEMIVASANELWISLFQTAMTCYLIYCKIGLASFAGILFFLVVLPVQMFIGAMAYKLRLECSGRTDERLELIKEVLSAIKVVKMYTWEKFFEKKIGDARK
jgi:ATP-binding cassette subfamily C (CFTR/MRP) protein 4